MPRSGIWCMVAACVAVTSVGCDEEEAEVAQTSSSAGAGGDLEPVSGEEGPGGADEAEAVDGPTGNVGGEAFAVRGVLAKRLGGSKIEVRLFNRAVSCESFDADYELSEDEKVIVVILQWPKEAEETITLGASNTSVFFQFCSGRECGRARCEPRAQEQGTLTVAEPSEDGARLSFDVASDQGALSGDVDFTLCE